MGLSVLTLRRGARYGHLCRVHSATCAAAPGKGKRSCLRALLRLTSSAAELGKGPACKKMYGEDQRHGITAASSCRCSEFAHLP